MDSDKYDIESLLSDDLLKTLSDMGLKMVNVPNDGNCMFHSIALHIPSIDHVHLRNSVAWYLQFQKNMMIEYLSLTYYDVFIMQDDSFNNNWDNFISYLKGFGNWKLLPAEYILKIIAEIYNLEIVIYTNNNNNIRHIYGFNYNKDNLKKIILVHLAELHWCSTGSI